jgi:hypothetical protein
MNATEVAQRIEIKERIATLESSKVKGCEHCENGVTFKNTASWGIVFTPCPYCNGGEAND